MGFAFYFGLLFCLASLLAIWVVWTCHKRKQQDLTAQRQLFYRACRAASIPDSEALQAEETRQRAKWIAQQYGFSNVGLEGLGQILDTEKSAYEARQRKII
jgi:hypothetical protein